MIHDILSRNEIYKNMKYAIPERNCFTDQDEQLEYPVWLMIKKNAMKYNIITIPKQPIVYNKRIHSSTRWPKWEANFMPLKLDYAMWCKTEWCV